MSHATAEAQMSETRSALERKHQAEADLLKSQSALVEERQKCEARIIAIDEELRLSGWVKPRKPRTKKS